LKKCLDQKIKKAYLEQEMEKYQKGESILFCEKLIPDIEPEEKSNFNI
jgi:hypothetical protein